MNDNVTFMTNRYYELRQAIACFLKDVNTFVPPYYHNHIVNAYNRSRMSWNTEQTAALTLFSAFYDGVLQLDELSYPGQIALLWAENHLDALQLE